MKIKNFVNVVAILLLVNPIYLFAMPDVSDALSEVTFQSSESEKIKLTKYKGKIILLFFGYTNCPDICPTTLMDISRTLKELKDEADKVQVVFVSVDYKRDTPRYLNEYVNYFDKRIIGVSSDKTNIDRINKYFKTTYALLDSDSKNYLVEHSSNLYIIGKDLVVKRIVASGLPYTEITKAVKKLID